MSPSRPCDPFRVGDLAGYVSGGVAPGYHLVPLQGTGWCRKGGSAAALGTLRLPGKELRQHDRGYRVRFKKSSDPRRRERAIRLAGPREGAAFTRRKAITFRRFPPERQRSCEEMGCHADPAAAGEASAFIFLKTNNCRFFSRDCGIRMTAIADFFTCSEPFRKARGEAP